MFTSSSMWVWKGASLCLDNYIGTHHHHNLGGLKKWCLPSCLLPACWKGTSLWPLSLSEHSWEQVWIKRWVLHLFLKVARAIIVLFLLLLKPVAQFASINGFMLMDAPSVNWRFPSSSGKLLSWETTVADKETVSWLIKIVSNQAF